MMHMLFGIGGYLCLCFCISITRWMCFPVAVEFALCYLQIVNACLLMIQLFTRSLCVMHHFDRKPKLFVGEKASDLNSLPASIITPLDLSTLLTGGKITAVACGKFDIGSSRSDQTAPRSIVVCSGYLQP